MPTERRIKRLEQMILEVAAETLQNEVRDPRMGLPSVTRVRLAPDLGRATLYWSSLEEGGARRRVAEALESALPLVQRRVAKALTTRVTPVLAWRFDPTLERAQRLEEIFHRLDEERGAASDDAPVGDDEAEAPPEGGLDDDADDPAQDRGSAPAD